MLSGGGRQIMLLRMMSSPTERSGEGSNGNGNAAPHHSLNSFVVSHQTPLSQAKFHRRPGLPKVRRSCGNCGSNSCLCTARFSLACRAHRKMTRTTRLLILYLVCRDRRRAAQGTCWLQARQSVCG